ARTDRQVAASARVSGFFAAAFGSSFFSVASFCLSSVSCFSISSICFCRSSGGAASATLPSRNRPAQTSGLRNQGRNMECLRAGGRARGKEGEDHDLAAVAPPRGGGDSRAHRLLF